MFIGTNSVSDYGMLNISLRHSSNRIVTSLERLATGMKINTAGDDAANLSLSEKLKSRISSSVVLQNNASTGIDLLNIVDGDLKTMTDIVQRIKNLTIQGLNGVYSEDEKNSINQEITELAKELKRIKESSQFADKKLFDIDSVSDLNIFISDTGSSQFIDLSSIANDMLFVDVLNNQKDVYMLKMDPGQSYYVEFEEKLYKLTNNSDTTKNLSYGYEASPNDENDSIKFVDDYSGVSSTYIGKYNNSQIQMGHGENYINIKAGETLQFTIGQNVFSITNSGSEEQTAVFKTDGKNINIISGNGISATYKFELSNYNIANGTESAISLIGNEEKYITYQNKLYRLKNNSSSEETFIFKNNFGNLQSISGNIDVSLIGNIDSSTNLSSQYKSLKLSANQTVYYEYNGQTYQLKNNTAQEQTVILNSRNTLINATSSISLTKVNTAETIEASSLNNPYFIDAIAGETYYIKTNDESGLYKITADSTGKLILDFDGQNINSLNGVGGNIEYLKNNIVTPDSNGTFSLDIKKEEATSILINGEIYTIENSKISMNNVDFVYDANNKTITCNNQIFQNFSNAEISGCLGSPLTPSAMSNNEFYIESLRSGETTYIKQGNDYFKITNNTGKTTDDILSYDSSSHSLSSSNSLSVEKLDSALFQTTTNEDKSIKLNSGETKILQLGNKSYEITNNGMNQTICFKFQNNNLIIDPDIEQSLNIKEYSLDNSSVQNLKYGDIYTTINAGEIQYISTGNKYFQIENTGGNRTVIYRRNNNSLSQISGTTVNENYLGNESFETRSSQNNYYIELEANETKYIKQGSFAFELTNTTNSQKTQVFTPNRNILYPQNPNVSITNLPLENTNNFEQMLPILDWALDVINTKRGTIGAQINILNSTIDMNKNREITFSMTNSTLRDTDIAKESAELTKASILQNITSSFMAQNKNISKSIILSLLNV